jgi:Amt family ammonium transporter
VQLKYRLRYDDALDVIGVHMVAGAVGILLTGVFASLAVNVEARPRE